MARLPVLKIAPMSGVRSVVPQVGQPAPSAIRPVIMPAFSRFSAFFSRFFFHKTTMRPINVPCRIAIKNTGSQSRKGRLKPKIPRKLSPSIFKQFRKPVENIRLNFEVPLDNRFIKSPKNKKLGTKPYQKRFSLVASRIPFPAKAKSSSHFLQFIIKYYHKFFEIVKKIVFGFLELPLLKYVFVKNIKP